MTECITSTGTNRGDDDKKGGVAATLLDAALVYANRGVPVFPCKATGMKAKSPLTRNGFKDASTDPDQITEWWTKWPDALIGMPTGSASGFVVLDVDVDVTKGKDGESSLRDLLLKHSQALPQTKTARTPRGGRHIYFQHPGIKVPTRTTCPGQDLDVRGDGGYVIVPPSESSTGQYVWVDDSITAAPLPGWLGDLIVAGTPKTKEKPSTSATATNPDESRIRSALKFIDASDRTVWRNVGFALKSHLGDAGWGPFDEWSQTASESYHAEVNRAQWQTFKADGGVTIATLFNYAKQGGWQPGLSRAEAGAHDQCIAHGESSCAPAPAVLAPTAKRLAELVSFTMDDPAELLCHRFLCQGAGLLLVGPTGIGKSSFSMQAMIHWASGLSAFGIKPARPLKSLLIQAENDEGDLAEMRDGIMAGLNLTEDQKQIAMANIIVAREDVRTGMTFFAGTVRPLLAEYRPDLLWIDPALSYLGAESNSQKDVGGFLRNQLNPLLREFNCGAVVIHHTSKPASGREKPDWSGGDFAYLGGGSADWANWARAVIALRSLGSHSVFELRAAKRGGRLGWTEADGVTRSYTKLIAHATTPGVICWHDADLSEIPKAVGGKSTLSKADVLNHVPPVDPISKEALRAKANAAGIALNRINPMITELLQDGELYEWHEKRAGTNDKLSFARIPQPKKGTIK